MVPHLHCPATIYLCVAYALRKAYQYWASIAYIFANFIENVTIDAKFLKISNYADPFKKKEYRVVCTVYAFCTMAEAVLRVCTIDELVKCIKSEGV